jgi:hypothetical protein
MDSIDVERYAVSQYVQSVYLGNPSSGLGTGTISEASLGVPNDRMWLAINGYCSDHEQGDPFASGYYDGPFGSTVGCGPGAGSVTPGASPNPTFDADTYVFVVGVQPGSPAIDIDLYEPGRDCSDAGNTGDSQLGPLLNVEIYGPSTTFDHDGFLATNSPTTSFGYPANACITNSPDGDGWWPAAAGLPSPGVNGGFYYVKVSARHPGSADSYPSLPFWEEWMSNSFALRAMRAGTTQLCALSTLDPTCPQVYALEWLPLYREVPSDESAFYLAEIDEDHAGETLEVTFFDAAEGVSNLQFVDSNDTAMPFEWRYADTSVGQLSGADYRETAFAGHTSTCSWMGTGGNPCLNTSNRDDWNDRFVVVRVEIPDDYTCGADCWWRVRYVTSGLPTDRSAWTISLNGDPVRLIE